MEFLDFLKTHSKISPIILTMNQKEKNATIYLLNDSYMLNKLWVEKGESRKFILVEIHHEEFVSRSKVSPLSSELFVEVGDILPVLLN